MSTVAVTPARGPELGSGFLPQEAPVSMKAPIVYGVVGLLALLVFGIFGRHGDANFATTTATDFFAIPTLTVNARLLGIVLGVVCVLLAGYSWWATTNRRKVGPWLPGAFAFAFVTAFLGWAIAGGTTPLQVTSLLVGTLFLAVPLTFGALSGVLGERVGVINIAIEGQLLAGAFLAAIAASLSDNVYVGLVAAPLAGVFVAAILALFTIKYAVNQMIVGVVLNVLVSGLTGFLYSTVLTANATAWNQPPGLSKIAIPVLSQIPIIGPVLFNQTLVVYIMYVTVAVVQIMLFRSRWGLRLRAVGEHPRAADTVGIKVNVTRWRNVLLGGAIAGLGGAFFTIGNQLAFGKDMTAGKGFIALAALIFGRWNPKGALGAALLFGFAEQARISLGITATAAIPSEFMLMTPYLVTILAVAGFVGRVRPPAAEGIHYSK